MVKYDEHPNLSELKKNNKSWEECFDCKISQRHFCKDKTDSKNLEIQNAAIFCSLSDNSPYSWSYAHVWLADKREINDREAEEIGEVMSSYLFQINFCPFCGEELIK